MKLGLFHVSVFLRCARKNIALESEEMQLPLLDSIEIYLNPETAYQSCQKGAHRHSKNKTIAVRGRKCPLLPSKPWPGPHPLSAVLQRGPQRACWGGSWAWHTKKCTKVDTPSPSWVASLGSCQDTAVEDLLLLNWCLSESCRINQEPMQCWGLPWPGARRAGWEACHPPSPGAVPQKALQHLGHLNPSAWSEGHLCHFKILHPATYWSCFLNLKVISANWGWPPSNSLWWL